MRRRAGVIRSSHKGFYAQTLEISRSFFEGVYDGQQMRKRAAQSIQLPNNQDIASFHKRERLRQSMSVIDSAKDVVFKQVTVIDTNGQKSIALQF